MKYSIGILLLFGAGCSNGEKTADSETVHSNSKTQPFTSLAFKAGCYVMVDGKDSSTLILNLNDSSVTGRMIIVQSKVAAREEWTFTGKIQDSVLYGEIGTNNSNRVDVKFLIRKDSLFESLIEVMPGPGQNGQDGFDKGNAYVRTDCKQ